MPTCSCRPRTRWIRRRAGGGPALAALEHLVEVTAENPHSPPDPQRRKRPCVDPVPNRLRVRLQSRSDLRHRQEFILRTGRTMDDAMIVSAQPTTRAPWLCSDSERSRITTGRDQTHHVHHSMRRPPQWRALQLGGSATLQDGRREVMPGHRCCCLVSRSVRVGVNFQHRAPALRIDARGGGSRRAVCASRRRLFPSVLLVRQRLASLSSPP